MNEQKYPNEIGEENESTEESEIALGEAEEKREKKLLSKLMRKVKKRNLIVASAILLIGVAVCLNFVLNGKDKTADAGYDYGKDAAKVSENDQKDKETDASLTDTTAQYFSSVQVSREKARDEALQVLATVAENGEASESVRNEALASISTMAKQMQYEADIESLIEAKGFEDCIAIVNGDSASIVVRAPELLPAQIAQINEIVYSQANILPANVTIIRKN